MPVYKDESSAISYKFIQNPQPIKDIDELYDAFDVNKGTNIKYVIIFSPHKSEPKQMTVQ